MFSSKTPHRALANSRRPLLVFTNENIKVFCYCRLQANGQTSNIVHRVLLFIFISVLHTIVIDKAAAVCGFSPLHFPPAQILPLSFAVWVVASTLRLNVDMVPACIVCLTEHRTHSRRQKEEEEKKRQKQWKRKKKEHSRLYFRFIYYIHFSCERRIKALAHHTDFLHLHFFPVSSFYFIPHLPIEIVFVLLNHAFTFHLNSYVNHVVFSKFIRISAFFCLLRSETIFPRFHSP